MTTFTTTLSRSMATTSGESDSDSKTKAYYMTAMSPNNNNNNNHSVNSNRTSINNFSTYGADDIFHENRSDPTSKLLTNALYKSNSFVSLPKSTIISPDTPNGPTDLEATDIRLGHIGLTTYSLAASMPEPTCPTISASTTPLRMFNSTLLFNNAASINDAGVPDNANDDEDDDDDTIITTSTSGADEHEVFLVNSGGGIAASSSVGNGVGVGRRSLRTHTKSSRNSFCYRTYAFINRNWYLSYLVPLCAVVGLLLVAYLTRDYAKRLLFWVEVQNPWLVFAIFQVLFVAVSFPVAFGYFVLLITSGYMFGCVKGFLTVILGANMGIAIAHLTIRSFRHRIPMHKLIKNETGRAILRVISGPRAFKVVLFTRLTPIPFGIQNAIFGVSSINARAYHTATLLGLLPAQTINVYLGSTLRSMQEVLNNHGTALTGYISFGVEIICGAALMFWVVQKARKELSETLLSDINTDGKLIDIDV